MNSCIYVGQVRHRRFTPRQHEFSYTLFQMYLDLEELPTLFDRFLFWSAKRKNLAWFKREDHLGDKEKRLSESVRDHVENTTGRRPQGPIRLLAHLRYFGFGFNPVSFYYCFDREDQQLETIVAEVNNTPWGEQHLYTLPLDSVQQGQKLFRFEQDKEFHVSPFMPLDMKYKWRLSAPDEALQVHLENHKNDIKVFDATLDLVRKPISHRNLAMVLMAYPLITLKVMLGIHFEALRLWLKKVPIHPHPNKQEAPRAVKKT